MELLQTGVDCSAIALWLGHESLETTQVYLHAHLALKEEVMEKLHPLNSKRLWQVPVWGPVACFPQHPINPPDHAV